jgi:N-acetylneuraminic acid mutarotase
MSAAAVGGKIYLLGGVSNIQGPTLADVEEYDPITEDWTPKANMPTKRTALATGVVGAQIYAMGGTAVVQGPGLSTVEGYNPVSNTWSKKMDMPTARVFLGAGVVDNKIYAVGGVAEGLGPAILPAMEAFDTGRLRVEAKEKLPTLWGQIKRGD